MSKVSPTRSLPPPPPSPTRSGECPNALYRHLWPSATQENARQIGKLQARVSQLEGCVTSLERANVIGASRLTDIEAGVPGQTMRRYAEDTLEQILAKLERIPCMSEDCDGVEDDGPATKHSPAATRCHRCAAVRLARSAVCHE